jgi:CheY-like chemotaxis protein
MNAKRILLIDDNQDITACYALLLREIGYEVRTSVNCQSALEELPNQPLYDLILVDYSLPIMSGLEFVERFRRRCPNGVSSTKLVVFSNHAKLGPVADSVRKTGALYLEKSGDIDEFVASVKQLAP